MQHERHETLERIESVRAAGDADVKTCGNCHLRLGHSQKMHITKMYRRILLWT